MESLKVSPTPKWLTMETPRFIMNNVLKQIVQPAPTSNCETASLSSSPSSSASSSSSFDKPDNRETYVGSYPESLDMRREEDRLKTFEKWPISFLSPELLSKNGFYYLGRGDEVRCAFCKVEIMRWMEGDDPAKDHQKWAPQCPFLRRQDESGNVPLDSVTPTGHDECGVRALTISTPTNSSTPRLAGPAHSRYATPAARLASFKDWPRSMRQKPEDLVEAGFFYTGQGDKTKCFYCDGGLKDWETDDIPWEQHARWFDRCAYVQLVKGREFIQKVISEANASSDTKETPAPQPTTESNDNAEEENPVEDSKLCKICYSEERNVCFVPCGHVVACAKCALSTDRCPMCRRTFHNAVRLYFS